MKYEHHRPTSGLQKSCNWCPSPSTGNFGNTEKAVAIEIIAIVKGLVWRPHTNWLPCCICTVQGCSGYILNARFYWTCRRAGLFHNPAVAPSNMRSQHSPSGLFPASYPANPSWSWSQPDCNLNKYSNQAPTHLYLHNFGIGWYWLMLLQEKDSVLRKLQKHVKYSNLGSWQTSRQISLDFMILMAGQWCTMYRFPTIAWVIYPRDA